MSYQLLKDLYDNIIGNTNISAMVAPTNVKVGWQNEIAAYPCITIMQAGGNSVGMLGFNRTVSGQIKENFGVQLDIYSRTSIKENYDILEVLINTMISSGYEKLSDVDFWDDDLNANRKMTRWNKIDIYKK